MSSVFLFMAFHFYADITGGTASKGKQGAGHYFLGVYSKRQHQTIYTPVSKGVFLARQNGEAFVTLLIPLSLGSWGIGFFLQERGIKRRRQQNKLSDSATSPLA